MTYVRLVPTYVRLVPTYVRFVPTSQRVIKIWLRALYEFHTSKGVGNSTLLELDSGSIFALPEEGKWQHVYAEFDANNVNKGS